MNGSITWNIKNADIKGLDLQQLSVYFTNKQMLCCNLMIGKSGSIDIVSVNDLKSLKTLYIGIIDSGLVEIVNDNGFQFVNFHFNSSNNLAKFWTSVKSHNTRKTFKACGLEKQGARLHKMQPKINLRGGPHITSSMRSQKRKLENATLPFGVSAVCSVDNGKNNSIIL